MKRKFVLVLILVLGVTATAFSAPIKYRAVLDGPSEAPPNASPGLGLAVVYFNRTTHVMDITASFSGLLGPTTASHIHCCTLVPGTGAASVATQTPSFIGFPLGVTSGVFANSYDTLDPATYRAGFITANIDVAGAEKALGKGLAEGRAYFNIHTSTFPGGEIRGFLTAVPEPGSLLLLAFGLAGLTVVSKRSAR